MPNMIIRSRYRRNRPHKSRVRVQSTYSMRRSSLTPLFLQDRFSQSLASRGTHLQDMQRGVLIGRLFKANRLPLLGLRSQSDRLKLRRDQKVSRTPLLDRPVGVPATHSVCQARVTRRRILFKMRIAGVGARRSPGRNGTYKRTPDSETTCKVKK